MGCKHINKAPSELFNSGAAGKTSAAQPTMMSEEKEDDYKEIPIEHRTWKDLNTIQLANFFF